MRVIDSFDGEYEFLSNFFPQPIKLDGTVYPTLENAFQASKTHVRKQREAFINITAGQAKRKGGRKARFVTLRPDWDSIKEDMMLELLRQKFSHTYLRVLLARTGDAELIEGNNWHDNIWGVCRCSTCDNCGLNRLGVLLTQIRDTIRAEIDSRPGDCDGDI